MFIPWFNCDIPIRSYLDLLWYINLKPSIVPFASHDTVTNSPQASKPARSSRFSWFFHQPVQTSPKVPPPPPSNATQLSPSRSRLFGLVIGINNYDNQGKLHGAVDDANSFGAYLKSELNVPSDHLINLRNQQASRNAIIAAFRDLQKDPRIEKGDPIVIYYAGHGGEQERGNGGEKIETIVPQDYSRQRGQEVPPIPDRTMASLLNDLSTAKGNNITVILDCCHSGSGTRDAEEENVNSLARVADIAPDDVTPDLDESICGSSRGSRISKGFAQKDMRSHILLAACSANELAREDIIFENKQGRGRGRFTSALLKLLMKVKPETLTYKEILNRLEPITGQNPQCEGFYQNRFLFDAKAPSPSRVFYKINVENGVVVLSAGAAHGISEGAQFTLYQDKTTPLFPSDSGIMSTDKILPFSTTLKPINGQSSLEFTSPALALQTRIGAAEELSLYVPLDERLIPVFEAIAQEMQGTGTHPCKIVLVDEKDRNKAKLEICMGENGQLVFNVLDDRILKYGYTRIPNTVNVNDVDDIKEVLQSAAQYYFHLDRSQVNSQIQNKISIEFAQLEESDTIHDEFGLPELTPTGENLIRNGILDFVVEEDGNYGIKITNATPWDLYISVFYFDNSELCITSYFACPVNEKYKVDAPLKKNGGVLTLGYGSAGASPFEYFIPDDVPLDIGFLKFFLSTIPVDLSHVVQESPFHGARGMKARERPATPAWGTIVIPVVQRRPQPSW